MNALDAPSEALEPWQTWLHVPDSDAKLALRHYGPEASHAAPVAHVVIAPAMGVPQTHYSAFAQWLAQCGYLVTTFDYRGHAASRHTPLRKVRATLMDWAQDGATVAQYLRHQQQRRRTHLPLLWIGHSVGAQLPGLCQPQLPIDGLLMVASGSGYWRDYALPTRRKAVLWWWGVQPVLTSMFGGLPGQRLGIIGDLPAGVVWQWRKWCMQPNYSLDVEGESVRQSYAAARYPIHALAMEDDEMMSLRSIESLMGWYANAPRTLQVLSPQQVGDGGPIGHMGFFRKKMAATLWPEALQVLQKWAGKEASAHACGAQVPEQSLQA